MHQILRATLIAMTLTATVHAQGLALPAQDMSLIADKTEEFRALLGDEDSNGDLGKPHAGLRSMRLKFHAGTVIDWYSTVAGADAEQSGKLSELLYKLIDEQQLEWQKAQVHDYGLFRLAGDRTGAAQVLLKGRAWKRGKSAWETQYARFFTLAQLEKIEQALKHRSEVQSREAVTAFLGLIDQHAFLQPAQRTALRGRLRDNHAKLLMSQPVFLHFTRQLSEVLKDSGVRKTLGTQHVAYLQHASRYRHIGETVAAAVQPGDSPNAHQKAIRYAMRKLRARVQRRFRIETDFLTQRYSLNEQQERRLRTAATGVKVKTIKRWAMIGMRRAESLLKDATDTSVISVGFDVNLSPSDERIWHKAVAQILGETPNDPKFARSAMVSQTMLGLDQELWLLPDQREKLQPLVDRAITDLQSVQIDRQPFLALADVMKAIADKDVKPMLSESQWTVWVSLQLSVTK